MQKEPFFTRLVDLHLNLKRGRIKRKKRKVERKKRKEKSKGDNLLLSSKTKIRLIVRETYLIVRTAGEERKKRKDRKEKEERKKKRKTERKKCFNSRGLKNCQFK